MTRPKLLLADDSITIRKVVELTFADEGVDVTTAANGEEAMLKFVEIQPDIVLVDVNMPDPTGYQICEMIKQDEMTRQIPVLLLVGSFEPFDQDEAERVGADGFLTKPFQSIRELVAKVDELLGTANGVGRIPAETADIDSLYDRSFGETAKITDEESAEILFGDTGMDDEMIETEHPAGEGDAAVVSAPKARMKADKTKRAYDWSAETAVQPNAETLGNDGFDVLTTLEDEEVLNLADNVDVDTLRDMEIAPGSEGSPRPDEPSEELIALVARRVIEKLSDKVIREIAQEAVPRIAESLIREALDEDKKA